MIKVKVASLLLIGFILVGFSSKKKKNINDPSFKVLEIDKIEQNMNGFDISNITIPISEVHQGGPPKDGIPAIDNPKFVDANQANYLANDDEVLAIYYNGIAKAYPIRILNYHEVVNDEFNEQVVIVTFCPLCGSGVAFLGSIDGAEFTFGVSGLLYNSDVLLYDRQTESLWSQLLGKAVSGPSVGKEIDLIAMEQTTWGNWKLRYPNSLVLDVNTGFERDYSRLPYAGYENNEQLYFPVNNENEILPKKEKVLGITINGVHKAYPFSILKKSNAELKDLVNNTNITISYNKESDSAIIKDEKGKLLPAITLFWFAWFAFHPDTLIYK